MVRSLLIARITTSPELRPTRSRMPRAGESGELRAAHLPNCVLHVEGRAAGPQRMVLVSDRRAENRHDAVAQDLVDRAFIGMHGIDHDLLKGIEQRTDLLSVQVLDEVGRALDIGEQDGDLFALAFDRGARAQDFLGKRRGSVEGGGRRACAPASGGG